MEEEEEEEEEDEEEDRGFLSPRASVGSMKPPQTKIQKMSQKLVDGVGVCWPGSVKVSTRKLPGQPQGKEPSTNNGRHVGNPSTWTLQ